jgi:hypothetical protein
MLPLEKVRLLATVVLSYKGYGIWCLDEAHIRFTNLLHIVTRAFGYRCSSDGFAERRS